jgi:hypothetical protein
MSTPGEMRDAIVRAHYVRLMASPDTARARAQAAYGISSAIAVALVAAGLFGGLDTQPPEVQGIAIAALVAWLVAAALFLHAVSSPFEMDLSATLSKDDVVKAALDGIRDERTKIDGWQRKAQLAAAVAALLTVAALVFALRTDRGREQEAMVMISAAGAARLQAACGDVPATLIGTVTENSLRERFVDMTLDPGMCGHASVGIALPRTAILGLAFRPPPTP